MQSNQNKKPNIIHVTFDCVRADRLGVAGNKKNLTPFLDSLARKGLFFENAYSLGPGSSVSFVGMFTSTYPLDYGGYSSIDRPRVMISEAMKAAGYTTVGIHSSPYFSDYFGYNRGWDTFRFLSYYEHRGGQTSPGIRRNSIKSRILKKQSSTQKWLNENMPPVAFLMKVFDRIVLTARKIVKEALHYKPAAFIAEDMNREAAKILDTVSGEPMYLWVHYLDAHLPYGLFNRMNRGFWNKIRFHVVDNLAFFFHLFPSVDKRLAPLYANMYDESIAYMDRNIKDLFEMLEARGILNDDAVVILHADHGEDFFNHGSIGHEQRLWNVNIHVPLILYSPARFAHEDITRPVSLLDVGPTILELGGATTPGTYKGASLLSPEPRDVVIQASESAGNLTDNKFTGIAIVADGHKFFQWKGERHLFDLADIDEQNDLYCEDHGLANELEKRAMIHAPTEPLR